MRYSILAAAALLAMEAAAIACSCINTDDPVELRRFAANAAEEAVAVVEVEALTAYGPARGGEQMRVVRTLAGQAPAQFRIERRGSPSSASCDIVYRVGDRDVVILYPASSTPAGLPAYRTSGLCMDHLLDKPVFRDTLIEAIGTPSEGRVGERG